MILTPIHLADLDAVAAAFVRHLPPGAPARAVFDRILASRARLDSGADTPADRAAAVGLARAFGLAVLDEEPSAAFSWDGRALRTRSEASVIVHEVAHYLVAPPERRVLPDFGLGAGPETGRKSEADAARAVDDETRETEEALSSLLGILWEVELGQPGILAFLEQNWLEGPQRPSSAAHFIRCLELLEGRGLIAADGRPRRPASLSAAA